MVRESASFHPFPSILHICRSKPSWRTKTTEYRHIMQTTSSLFWLNLDIIDSSIGRVLNTHMPSASLVWLPPPSNLTLSDDLVHVWRASLDQPMAVVERMGDMLSEDERVRAARFFFERDR